MTLNEKMAFEVWAGLLMLLVVIGSAAGATLLLNNPNTANQVKTQASNNTQQPVTPFATDADITSTGLGITNAILGGKNSP